jgi:hypothetical protein
LFSLLDDNSGMQYAYTILRLHLSTPFSLRLVQGYVLAAHIGSSSFIQTAGSCVVMLNYWLHMP